MLNSLRRVGTELAEGLGRAWENLAEGWRELVSRASGALTHFSRGRDAGSGQPPAASYPSWGLLAGEVIETGKDLVVRLEIPGIEKQDCEISVEGNSLVVRGEKRAQWEEQGEHYYVLERAYGSFQRVIPLPRTVDRDAASAQYENGVLTVRLPKSGGVDAHRIPVK